MRDPDSTLSLRSAVATALLALAALVAGCDSDSTYRSPTQPDGFNPSQEVWNAFYLGDATVLADSVAAACGYGAAYPVNEATWSAERRGSSLKLTQTYGDLSDEMPYFGTFDGRRFVGTPGPPQSVSDCELREAWIDVTFSEDFSSFEAHEASYWGPRENEQVVAFHWVAQRR